jgi:NAD(P)-dependent dehydrogenase (short-subunit alcohol dehydrogenase family)
MGNQLADKVAVVTGAGGNIGRAEALALAREGASVLVNDIDPNTAQKTVELLREAGAQAALNTASASSWKGGEAIIGTALKAFGRIDILMNTAGTARPRRIDEMSEEDWDYVVDVHLKGYAATIRHAAPHFIAQRSGVIINTGSTSGLGHIRMANYSAGKEGVAGLTRTVARDLGEFGVRCNTIRPTSHLPSPMMGPEMIFTLEESVRLGLPINGGFTMRVNATPMPEHVAAFAVLLCLPEMAHVSGEDFFIGGEEVGRFFGPELIRSQFLPGGWTLEALRDPTVLTHLLRGFVNHYVKTVPSAG